MPSSIIQITEEILEKRESILQITLSSPTSADTEYKKVILRPVTIKKAPVWQAERYKEKKVFHLNIPQTEAESAFQKLLPQYKQICLFFPGETRTYSNPKNLSYKESVSANLMQKSASEQQNNRQKDYILKEGENIPALVDLGVFTKDFKIVNSKYDKYKQINRFVELINDEFANLPDREITILDFGCGKSYLTFIVYYYFTHIKKVKTKIIGYDLKEDVVKNCNEIAKKYGYDDLEFVVSDVTKDVLYDRSIDMIISLHACDTATDYALFYAIQKNVKCIFSVPCCQHEINATIKKGGEMDIFLKYGIVKERMSALLTDTVRAMVLEDMGYAVDMIEFVDLSHSPKNIMLRAKKTKAKSTKNTAAIQVLVDKYKFRQTLFELVKKM